MSEHNGNGRVDFRARRRRIDVAVPELPGVTFHLQALSVVELRKAAEAGDDALHELSLALVNEQGERIYENDLDNLREMSVGVYDTLLKALRDLHGITSEQQESIAKKSEASLGTASASA